MNAVITHAPGTFCWVELTTTDADAAKAFYRELFGWSDTEMPAGPEATYVMLQHDGRDVGGLYEMTEEQRIEQGIRPHWLLYVAVEDVEEATEQVRRLGGTVRVEPFDVMTAGRMAVVHDPTGSLFALWEAREHPGAGVTGQPSALCWSELATRDTASAGAFLSDLFGWDAQTQPMADTGTEYTTFARNGQEVGGMLQMNEEWGEMPAAWMPYFGVADLDAALEQVPVLGGEVAVGPMEAEGVGRFAVVQDPQGAFLSVIQLDTFG